MLNKTINSLNQGFVLRKNVVYVSLNKTTMSLLYLLYKDGYILQYRIVGQFIKVYLNISSKFHFFIKPFFSENKKYIFKFEELLKCRNRWNLLGDIYISTNAGIKNITKLIPYQIGGRAVFVVFSI